MTEYADRIPAPRPTGFITVGCGHTPEQHRHDDGQAADQRSANRARAAGLMHRRLLAYRRAVARLTPALGHGRCHHCRMPWGNGNRSGHVVNYTRTKGIFVICEWCWPNTTQAERLQYAAALVFGTWARSGVPIEDCHRDWPAIRNAFLTEG